jgi:hypothetical protein
MRSTATGATTSNLLVPTTAPFANDVSLKWITTVLGSTAASVRTTFCTSDHVSFDLLTRLVLQASQITNISFCL